MTGSLGSTCSCPSAPIRSPRPHRRGSIAMVGISDPAVWRPRLLAALVVAAIPRFCRDSETARWHPAFCRSPRRGRPRTTRSIVNRRTYGRPGTDDCRSPGRIQRVLPVAGAFRADHTEIIAAAVPSSSFTISAERGIAATTSAASNRAALSRTLIEEVRFATDWTTAMPSAPIMAKPRLRSSLAEGRSASDIRSAQVNLAST